MNQGGHFRVSGADEFFSFSSPATANNNTSPRSRSRLTKLRKPKSSAYIPLPNGKSATGFGWSSEWMPPTNGKVDDKFTFPGFSVADATFSTTEELANEFERLSVSASLSGGRGSPFSCGNTSYFEFKSTNTGGSRDVDSVSIPELPRKFNLDGSGSATHDKDVKHGTDPMNKENTFIQEAAMPPNNGGFCSSSASTSSTSSATNIRDQHETNFTRDTIANGHIGEGFCFTGKFDVSISPAIKSNFNRKGKSVQKRHAGKWANLKKKTENVNLNMESKVDPTSCGKESASKEFRFGPGSPQPYSPMDMSPNPVNHAQHSNQAPTTSNGTFTQSGRLESSERTTQDGNHHPPDEDSSYAAQQLNIGKNVNGTHIYDTQGCGLVGVRKTPPEEFALESGTESFNTATEDLELDTNNTTSTASSCNSESDGTTNFFPVCNSEDTFGTKFIFSASPSSVMPVSVRHFKAVNRSKGFDSYRSTATSEFFSLFASDQHLKDLSQDHVKASLTCSQLKPEMVSSTSIGDEVKHQPNGAPEPTTVALEACEKWRLRGNEAYANGDLSKAEEYYTRGVRCIPKSEKSRSRHRALMLCYSNRAATRMSLGRLREAVKDCKLAAGIDPSFLRAHVRAANCYLALGEVEEALKHFKYCLQSRSGVSTDRKILKEASEGLQKVQKASTGMSRSIESIQQGTCSDAEDALRSADGALAICLYSEKLLEIKAEALLVLQKYSKVIQLCQESLDSAERNSKTTGVNCRHENPKSASLHGSLYFRLWRFRLMLKSYFFLGKLEEALALLEKHESLRKGSETLESLIPLAAVVRELLRYKAAGNEAFQSGNYAEAVEHYTAALAFNADSHPFAAICFCNRAAAYKAQGKIVDSIADCNLAIALERDYLKAISRRASLYESIRDYGQAAKDTEIIVSLLKKQADISLKKSQEKSTNSGIPIDLRQARLQLSRLEDLAKKDTPLNMYLILDVKSSASASDIKKAYRQAALKHHPDKAGQILAKGNSRRNETWKRIAKDIQRDADILFKLIGEAYTVLSDPAQRLGYDAEEEIRNMSKKNRESFTSRTHFDEHKYSFHKSKSRRQTNDFWRSQGYF